MNDITKSQWNDCTQEEREQVYGEWVRGYNYTDHIDDANVALLTMKWNYYVDQNLIHQAEAEIENAVQHHKKIVVFSGGDSPANLSHPAVMLFEAAGYRSAQGLAYHSGQPFFLKDYLQVYCGGELQARPKSPVPTLGFCGQADANALTSVYRVLRNQVRKLQYRAGLIKWAPPPFETTRFRRRVLRQFENRPRIKTDFLMRRRYHAGNEKDSADYSAQKLEFVQNILNTDYTLCIRGGWNFSIRFYETLALGRIPVFIDTDCLLPFEDKIPYRQIFPWIDVKDLPRAASILADFHQSLSDEDFLDLQRKCRQLWVEHYTANGFYQDLQAKIMEWIV